MTEIENVGVTDKTTWAQTLLCVGWRQTSGESVCKSELILMRWMMKDEHTVIDYYDHRHSRYSLWNIHCWWFRDFFLRSWKVCIYSVGFSFVSVYNWNNTLACINRHRVQIILQVSINVWQKSRVFSHIIFSSKKNKCYWDSVGCIFQCVCVFFKNHLSLLYHFSVIIETGNCGGRMGQVGVKPWLDLQIRLKEFANYCQFVWPWCDE